MVSDGERPETNEGEECEFHRKFLGLEKQPAQAGTQTREGAGGKAEAPQNGDDEPKRPPSTHTRYTQHTATYVIHGKKGAGTSAKEGTGRKGATSPNRMLTSRVAELIVTKRGRKEVEGEDYGAH